jgi:hypothetical protein
MCAINGFNFPNKELIIKMKAVYLKIEGLMLKVFT